MDRYSFGTFLVYQHNQEAFTLCHDVANLRADAPLPIVLIGDTGTGKTHLLYSIVSRIRTSESATGIAYVTANEIPDSVRNLLDHPAPVKDARHAVLLVDHLESFHADIDVLERIIRLFIDNGHAVVCASNIHPARITHFPGSFSKLLDDGHRVSILPEDSPSRLELIEYTIREEHEGIIARLEQEIVELKQFVTSTSEGHESEEDEESLLFSVRKELEVTKAELEMAQAKLAARTLHAAHPEGEDAPTIDVHGLLEEIEQLRGENALNAVAAKEVTMLRDRMFDLEAERDKLREQVRNESSTSDTAKESDSDEQDVRDEARSLAQRAEQMVNAMKENRERYTESQKKHQQQLTEIKELESIFRKHEEMTLAAPSGGSQADNDRLKHLEQERDSVKEQYASLKDRSQAIEAERNQVYGEFTRQKEELQRCINDLEEAKSLLTEKTEAMITLDMSLEQLRKDQAESTGRFNAEIARYEDRIAHYKSATDESKQNEEFLENELTTLQAHLLEASERVDRIVSNKPDDESDKSIGNEASTNGSEEQVPSMQKETDDTPVPEPPASIH